jgi:hypothetical protein
MTSVLLLDENRASGLGLLQGAPPKVVWIGLGNCSTAEVKQLFRRRHRQIEQPMPGLDSEALDFRAASESFAGTRRLARRDLETLRLVTGHQERKMPTAGVC